MCGRYAFTGWDPELVRAYDIEQSRIRPRYNIAPTQMGTVILFDPDKRKPDVQELYWGLIPFWAKDKSLGVRMINARSETVDEKPSFKAAFRHRRCLVPATGFYEWKREGKTKTPFYFSPKLSPLVFAGLWEDWSDGNEHIRSYTILTTEANGLMRPIHDRMPIILPADAWDRWLNPKIDKHDDLKDLLVPCDDDDLHRQAISSFVNKVGNEGPDCIRAVDQ